MMPTMTRQQFEELSFEEFMEWARENIDDVTDEDTLIQFAKDKIDDDSLMSQYMFSRLFGKTAYPT